MIATQSHAMPARLWRGIDRLVIDCAVEPAAADAASGNLCALLVAEAERGARMPVVADAAARPAPGDIILSARFAPAGEGAGVSLTAMLRRAVPVDDAESPLTAPPRALAIGDDAPDGTVAIDISATLDRLLPWRRAPARRPGRPQPQS